MTTDLFTYKYFKLLVFLFAIFSGIGKANAGCLSDYDFYKVITIQNTKVSDDLDDFPILIQHIDPDLRTTGNGGKVQNISGYDIVFTAADGMTVLDHQVEAYDALTGKITMWVRIPFLSGSLNTDIRIYYGNSSISINPSTTNVWDSNHKAVYHFESISTIGNDATSNGVNLINNGIDNFVGVADDGANLELNENLTGTSSTSANISGDLTVSTWVKAHNIQTSSFDNTLVNFGGTGSTGPGQDNAQYYLSIDNDWKLRTFWETGSGTNVVSVSTLPSNPSINQWTLLSVTRQSSSKKVRFYQNGVQVGIPVIYSDNPSGGVNSFLRIGGGIQIASFDFDGELDELRISDSRRNADWLLTEYNSISDPNSFYNITSEFQTNANFSYSIGEFCKTATDPSPNITGQSGGVFASTPGLLINSATGQVDLSASTIGSYVVTYTAPSGCSSTRNFVIDATAPIITTCQSSVNVTASSSCDHTLADYTSALGYTDNCNVTVTQNPLPGTVINVGTTNVVMTAIDDNGNFSTCNFDVIVTSSLSPTVLSCGDNLFGESTIGELNSTNVFSCAAFPTPGQDKLYQVNVPAGNYQVIVGLNNVSDNNPFTELFWLGGFCPTSGNCIEQKQYRNMMQSFQGGGNTVNFFAAGPGTYYLVVDSQGDGVTSYDLSLNCISSGIKLDDTGCNNDSDNDGVVTRIDGNISTSLTQCQHVEICQEIFVANEDNVEWLDSVSIILDSCYTNVTNIFTPHPGGAYETGAWIPTYNAGNNQISWQFNNTGTPVFGDGYKLTASYDCTTGFPHNYTFCFEADISSTCPSDDDLDIRVYVSDDALGVGINDIAGADETTIDNLNLTTVLFPTLTYSASSFCPSGTASPSFSPVGGSFSSSAGLVINSSTGIVDLGTSTPGTYVVTYTESTGCKSNTFNITIGDNVNPTITCPGVVTVNVDAGSCLATGVTLGTPVTGDNCGVQNVSNDAPTSFPLGATTVTWTVTDNSNNTATCTQIVTVIDNINPTITCPGGVTVNVDAGSCVATGVTLGTPVTGDNCGVQNVSNDAPTSFPLGATTVTWTVTDNANNTAMCTQIVTVIDNINPTITCPGGVTVNVDAGSCLATGVTLGTPVTGDNCGVQNVSNDAPASFPLGATTVTWTVTDNSNNTATCTQIVTVIDNINPTITCPGGVTVNVDAGSCLATGVTLGTPLTGDNCGIQSVANDAPTSFPLGVTTVTWTVTDNSNNTNTCTQLITVIDNILPSIICANDTVISTDATSCDASGVVLNLPIINENCSVLSVVNDAPGIFPMGSTNVLWTVTDGSNNSETCVQIVTVVDTISPDLMCPDSVIVNNFMDSCGISSSSISLGTLITWDNCFIGVTSDDLQAYYPVGNHNLTYTAQDLSGNLGSCIQVIQVVDVQVPDLNCPSDTIVVVNPNSCVATFNAQAAFSSFDNCGIDSSYFSSSGMSFALGVNTLNYTSVDIHSNSITCSQIITVVDTTLPYINCVPDTVICDSVFGYSLSYGDNCSVVSFTQITGLDSGVVYPIGITTNVFEVIDQSGNRDTCFFEVTRYATGDASWSAPQDSLCLSGDLLSLDSYITGTTNGIFSGAGVTGVLFDPSVAQIGQHSITYSTGAGVCIQDSMHIITVIDAASTSAGMDDSICGLDYSFDNSTSFLNGLWTSPLSNATFVDANNINTDVTEDDYVTSHFIWTITSPSNCNYQDTISVTFTEQPSADAGEDMVTYQALEAYLQGVVPDNGSGIWMTNDNINISDAIDNESQVSVDDYGSYELVWVIENGVCPIAEDEVTLTFQELLLPQGISPNGDGFNDYLEIDGLDQFETRKLVVFDRWGKLVYESENYDNLWNGVNVYGEELSNDTYFYEITLDEFVFKGFVTVKK